MVKNFWVFYYCQEAKKHLQKQIVHCNYRMIGRMLTQKKRNHAICYSYFSLFVLSINVVIYNYIVAGPYIIQMNLGESRNTTCANSNTIGVDQNC